MLTVLSWYNIWICEKGPGNKVFLIRILFCLLKSIYNSCAFQSIYLALPYPVLGKGISCLVEFCGCLESPLPVPPCLRTLLLVILSQLLNSCLVESCRCLVSPLSVLPPNSEGKLTQGYVAKVKLLRRGAYKGPSWPPAANLYGLY